tara:strand:- start:1656 stop:1943 length:288 start_codon:yes stop_codon:yes gene_type:complete
MQTEKQVLESCVRWGVVAKYSEVVQGSDKASGAYCRFYTLQKVLELPYSAQCKGLSIEELESFCENLSKYALDSDLELQEVFQSLDLTDLENKLK